MEDWTNTMKRNLIVISLILALVALLGGYILQQRYYRYELDLTTDRPDAVYALNEPIKFQVSLRSYGRPVTGKVKYVLSNDGVSLSTGESRINQGVLTLDAKRETPGFARCDVAFEVLPGKTISARATAAVEPETILAEISAPEDFDAFWAEQKKQLADVPLNSKLKPVWSTASGVDAFEVKVDCVGEPVSGYFARPQNAKPSSLPALLRVHGAGVSSASLTNVVQIGEQGMLSLEINAHGIPNGRPKSFYRELATTTLKDYFHQGKSNRNSCYFLGMYLRAKRAIDFLAAQAEWDGKVMLVHGNSQGGAQAIAVAALDDRVTMIALGTPGFCNQAGTISGWPWFVEKDAEGVPIQQMRETSRYFDSVNFAARTSADVIMSVGFVDDACPPTSVYMAYNQFSGKKQIINRPKMAHEHPVAIKKLFYQAFQAHIDQVQDNQDLATGVH